MQQTYNPSLHYRSLYQLLEKMPKHLRGISSSSSSSTTIAWPVFYVTEIFLFHPLQHLGRTRVSGQPEDSHLPEAEAITDGLARNGPVLKGQPKRTAGWTTTKFCSSQWMPRAELHREAGFPSLKTRVSSSYLFLQQEQQQQKHWAPTMGKAWARSTHHHSRHFLNQLRKMKITSDVDRELLMCWELWYLMWTVSPWP